MDRYSIKAKRNVTGQHGIKLGADMEVEIQNNGNPLASKEGKAAIGRAFEYKYGVDLERGGLLNVTQLDVKRK